MLKKYMEEIYWRIMRRNLTAVLVVTPLAVLYFRALITFRPDQLRSLIITVCWLLVPLNLISMLHHWLVLKPMIRTVDRIKAGAEVPPGDWKKAEKSALIFPYFNFLNAAVLFTVGGVILTKVIHYQCGLSSEDAFFIQASAMTSGIVGGLGMFYACRKPLREELTLILERWPGASLKPSFFMPISVKLAASFMLVILLVLTFLGFFSFATIISMFKENKKEAQSDRLLTIGALCNKFGGNDYEKMKSFLGTAGKPGESFCILGENGATLFCTGVIPSSKVLASLSGVSAANFIAEQNTGWNWAWLSAENGRDRILNGWEPWKTNAIRAKLRSYYFKIAIVALLVGLGLGIYTSIDIATPLRELSRTAVEITEGKENTRTTPGAEDETGILGRAFNRMTSVLLSQLKEELKRSRSMMNSIRDAVETLAPMSQQLVVISGQQASGSMRQASSAEEAASTSQEIAAVSKQIAENSADVASTSENALVSTKEAQQHINTTRQTFSDIDEKMQNIAGSVTNLSDQSQEVGGIVRIIEEINDQTTLLAFNAAIEAAGAGEHGRRFGVVAQEIQRLAHNTNQSTKKIREIISHMQSFLSGSIATVGEGGKAVGNGRIVIEEMARLIGIIFKAASDATFRMKEVDLMTSQQATASDQMANTLTEVRETAHQSSLASEELSSSVVEIEKIVLRLKEHIEQDNNESLLSKVG